MPPSGYPNSALSLFCRFASSRMGSPWSKLANSMPKSKTPFKKKKPQAEPHRNLQSDPRLSKIPYWQVNIPVDERQEQCPVFLQSIGERYEKMINCRADDFHYLSWPEVKEIIGLQNHIFSTQTSLLNCDKIRTQSIDFRERR